MAGAVWEQLEPLLVRLDPIHHELLHRSIRNWVVDVRSDIDLFLGEMVRGIDGARTLVFHMMSKYTFFT